MCKRKFRSMLPAQAPPLLQRLLVTMCLALLGAFATSAQAAKFDERVRAPKTLSAAALSERVDSVMRPLRDGSMTPLMLIRDRGAHGKWIETRWIVEEAINSQKAFDLSKYGLVSRGDGSYSVDLAKYPEWRALEERAVSFQSSSARPLLEQQLARRGFRAHDLTALWQYVDTHPPMALSSREIRPLAVDMSERIRLLKQKGQPIDRSDIMAFRYQRTKLSAEAMRVWAVGLFDSVDLQRQRIIESFLTSTDSTLVILPDDVERIVDLTIEALASGSYVKNLDNAETEVRP